MEKTGKPSLIPLDTRNHPIYRIVGYVGNVPQLARLEDVYITHFATCPCASEFSGSKK